MAANQSAYDTLEDLLDRERAYLLEGRLDDLSRLADAKTRLLQDVAQLPNQARLTTLRAKANRNARLLVAAAEGVKSVVDRIGSIRKGPKPLTTYSASGSRTSLGAPRNSVEKRA